jgi:hypothetical protein
MLRGESVKGGLAGLEAGPRPRVGHARSAGAADLVPGRGRAAAGHAAAAAQTSFLPTCLLMSDLWMCGMTPPPAMVAWGRGEGAVAAAVGKGGAIERQGSPRQRTPAAAPRRSPLARTHLDEGVQLLVTADGELQVARRDALHLRC